MKHLTPDWPAPENIRAAVTLRPEGASNGAFAGLNLARHVGDELDAVVANRRELTTALRLPSEPCWLTQVHGNHWRRVDAQTSPGDEADAAFTDQAGVVCAVMTADCLPVLFCTQDGRQCGVAHAGWRGLLGGILSASVAAFAVPAEELLVWLGPAIGACHYEVSDDLRERFLAASPNPDIRESRTAAFRSARSGHCYASLYTLARIDLEAAGIREIGGGEKCTYCDPSSYFSYRRDGETGRFATLIWREPVDCHATNV